MTPYGLRFRRVREARGLSQDDLAAKSGVYQSTISRLERGETTGIEFDVLDKLAQALDVDPGFFFTRYCP